MLNIGIVGYVYIVPIKNIIRETGGMKQKENWTIIYCSVSRWRPQKVDKRMVLEHTHGLFIT